MLESRAVRSALGAAPDSSSRRWLEFSVFKNLTAESHEQTNKYPECHFRVRFRTRSPTRLLRERYLFLRPDQNLKLMNRIRIRISLRNADYLPFVKFKETPFLFFTFLFS